MLCGNWDGTVNHMIKMQQTGAKGMKEKISFGGKDDPQGFLEKLGLVLLCWAFKGVQEEIPPEEASTLQIGLVAFPSGQCTSPQLNPCHRLFEQDSHKNSLSAPL